MTYQSHFLSTSNFIFDTENDVKLDLKNVRNDCKYQRHTVLGKSVAKMEKKKPKGKREKKRRKVRVKEKSDVSIEKIDYL